MSDQMRVKRAHIISASNVTSSAAMFFDIWGCVPPVISGMIGGDAVRDMRALIAAHAIVNEEHLGENLQPDVVPARLLTFAPV